jgi:hypothetical protein
VCSYRRLSRSFGTRQARSTSVLSVTSLLSDHGIIRHEHANHVVIQLPAKTWSTRLDEESGHRVAELMQQASMREADVIRRLVVIGLRAVKEPADLLRT